MQGVQPRSNSVCCRHGARKAESTCRGDRVPASRRSRSTRRACSTCPRRPLACPAAATTYRQRPAAPQHARRRPQPEQHDCAVQDGPVCRQAAPRPFALSATLPRPRAAVVRAKPVRPAPVCAGPAHRRLRARPHLCFRAPALHPDPRGTVQTYVLEQWTRPGVCSTAPGQALGHRT